MIQPPFYIIIKKKCTKKNPGELFPDFFFVLLAFRAI
ncbi:hypothetical protein B14911_27600 [Bacillus sp. NRRL B-14911]|nr:hypothetical protein B14911_27600 [Bacillus sp. NRRL B-14911]